MLNNKGMSLMEILVSIILISVVLVFLFELLIDLKNESKNNDYASNNQINRMEIIYNLENELNKYRLVGLKDESTSDNLVLDFYYDVEGKEVKTTLETLKEDNTYLMRYRGIDNKFTYKMQGAEVNPCAYFTSYIDEDTSNYYFKLNIFVYSDPYHERNNLGFNNALDDIEISYMGNSNNLRKDEEYLTAHNYTNEKVGACSN